MMVLTKSHIILASHLVIALCLLTIVTMQYVVPFVSAHYYASEFQRLTLECDQAMHDEAALRSGTAGATKDEALTVSADIGLAVCHDYDKLRKRMLILGITDEQLALLGLEALEIDQIPVARMVQPHRMDRF